MKAIENRLVEGLNNNTNTFYFPYPNFSIKTSIDFLTLSIRGITEPHFFSDILISNGFKSISNEKLAEGNYLMKWSFKNHEHNVTVELLYGSKKSYYPPMLVKIHDPNQEVIDFFNQIFVDSNILPKLSFVELTFDFYTRDVINLREYLKAHLFMKYQRSESGRKKTTFYANNLRKSVRGMRIYSRPGWDHARMELVLKSRLLKRLRISYPLGSIDSLDLTRFFSFMGVDWDGLYRYMLRFNQNLIKECDQRHSGMGNLVRCQILSWIRCMEEDESGRTNPMMEQVEALKSYNGIPNYSRFLRPIDGFGSEFMSQVSKQKFLRHSGRPYKTMEHNVHIYRIWKEA